VTLRKDHHTKPSRPGFLRDVARFVLPTGILIGIAGLSILTLGSKLYDERTARTLLLTTLVLSSAGTLSRVLWADGILRWLAFSVFPIYLPAMYVPVFGYFFYLTPLALGQWALAASAALVVTGLGLLWDWREVRRSDSPVGNTASH